MCVVLTVDLSVVGEWSVGWCVGMLWVGGKPY